MWGDGGAYGAWADAMDRWARGEPTDLAALPPLVREHFDADTWVRLITRITTALNGRLIAWAAATSRSLSYTRDEFAMAQALTHARTGLRAVRAVAALPQLPEDQRAQLLGLVDGQVREAQAQLEKQASASLGHGDRYAEQRLRTIRDNSLGAVLDETPAPAVAAGWLDATDPPRRKVIPG